MDVLFSNCLSVHLSICFSVCLSAPAPGVSEDGPGEDTDRRERAAGVSTKLGVSQGDKNTNTPSMS